MAWALRAPVRRWPGRRRSGSGSLAKAAGSRSPGLTRLAVSLMPALASRCSVGSRPVPAVGSGRASLGSASEARADVGLAHRIGEIEAQAAALEQRGAEPAGGSVSEAHAATGTLPPGADPDIAALIAQLKVLRRQLALLPERSARRRHMAPRRQTFFSPQLPHKSGCRASAPTENPRTNRHGPA
jgi:hypothetical protein